MQTKLLLALFLPVLFFACDQENEILQPANLDHITRRDPCFELTTSHWLTGQSTIRLVPEAAPQETLGSSAPVNRYVIEASGDAMSELYARGFSELNLIYHTGTNRLTGEMVTTFYYGEVLELTIDDEAQVKYQGEAITLQVEVKKATFTTEAEVFNLSYGEISILLPAKPEGPIQVDISTNTTLCAR
jgi:hypothetical protein